MLSATGVTVHYGSTTALDAVDLLVGDGEIMGVLGPSGSGKSTLLRAVAGLVALEAGTVAWDGRDLAGVPPHRRGMGLMFQDHALFPHRDVLGNVEFGLRMQRRARGEIEQRSRELLELVGLTGFEHRRVRELSGGEQQRVALARALAPSPRLLMLDEPLGALDRALRERLVGDVRDVLNAVGTTALFVTHDQDEAFAVADRVAVMHEGRIEQVASPVELWQEPAGEAVARLLGWRVTAGLGRGREVVRPDGIHLAPTDAHATTAGVVVRRTFRRDHTLVTVRLADTSAVDVLVLGADAPAPGAHVAVVVDDDARRPIP